MSAVPLGDDLGIEAATDLKQHLAPHVAQPGPLVLDAGTVQRVHTASLQVLCSFVRQREQAGLATDFSAVSQSFRDGRLVSIGGGADEVMLGIICKLEGTLPKGAH